MKRSKWKGYYIDQYLISQKFKNNKKKIIWSRNSTIPQNLIDQYVYIHNGRIFQKVYINREKVGFKFGDFAITRKFTKKQKKKK